MDNFKVTQIGAQKDSQMYTLGSDSSDEYAEEYSDG